MSRAMGSSCVFTCWGAASWPGGRVMLVFGASAAAGAGSCAGGGAPFGVVVVCGCTLVAVMAGGVAPVCGSGCGRWWVLRWRKVCGVSRGGAGGVGCDCEPFVKILLKCMTPWPHPEKEGDSDWVNISPHSFQKGRRTRLFGDVETHETQTHKRLKAHSVTPSKKRLLTEPGVDTRGDKRLRQSIQPAASTIY